MHVVMLIDEQRYRRETRMLERLARGMLDHGWQVSRLLPGSVIDAMEDEHAVVTPGVENHGYPSRVLPWQRRMHIRRFPEQLLTADVVLGIGSGAWRWAADLAASCDAVALLDVWCLEQVRRARKPKPESSVCGYVACTQPLAKALAGEIGPELVSCVPYGVAVDQACPARPAPTDGQPISVAMIDAGLDIGSYQAVLGAIRRLITEGMNLQLVVEVRGPQEHNLWQYARQLDLLDHVASVADGSACRSLIVECDLLLLPDRFGQMRSIILETMLHGVPIVAARDPMIDVFSDGHTALLIDREEPDAWHTAIRKLLTDKELYTLMSRTSAEIAAQSHNATTQLAGLIATLETAVTGGTMSFAPAGSGSESPQL